MEILWQADTPLSAYDLQDQLPLATDSGRPRAATTVLTVLGRLERKGLVTRERDGRAHRYRAVGSREDHVAELMNDALDAAGPGPLAVSLILTLGRGVLAALEADGTAARLTARGVMLIPDLCWCSITEPVFPPAARVVMTNSAKYAHYGPGLSGRALRFGSLGDCARAALTGQAPQGLPPWLKE